MSTDLITEIQAQPREFAAKLEAMRAALEAVTAQLAAVTAERDAALAEVARFDAKRKWRFDFAWPAQKVAVEVNGEAWQTKGGGRHGKAADLEKLNAAQAQGWRVFQYTPAMLGGGPVSCIGQVLEALGKD